MRQLAKLAAMPCRPLMSGVLALCLSGCRMQRSVLAPVTHQARQINHLWWMFLGVTAAVYVVVLFLLVRIAFRSRLADDLVPPREPDDRVINRMVGSGVAVTVVLLLGLLLATYSTQRAQPAAAGADPLTIRITGKQWWWHVEYPDTDPSRVFSTANEIHLPAGRPVQFLLQGADVIHSFWIPSLGGKLDLVPGHPGSFWIQADRLGTFRGQCAEFCGYQHAHMGLVAVVESAADFARWQEAQRRNAPEPDTDARRRGQQLFLTRTCVMCHTVNGTPAGSRIGPPLTHFASQPTFAAGSFPRTREHVAAWVRDPQAMKPGVKMPATPLSDGELNDLVDYLESLK